MALPITLSGFDGTLTVQLNGPYKSAAGNWYLFGASASDTTKFRAQKASTLDGSYATVGTDASPSGKILRAMSSFQVGDVIHICVSSYTGVSSGSTDYHYITFNMATDAFGTIEKRRAEVTG